MSSENKTGDVCEDEKSVLIWKSTEKEDTYANALQNQKIEDMAQESTEKH